MADVVLGPSVPGMSVLGDGRRIGDAAMRTARHRAVRSLLLSACASLIVALGGAAPASAAFGYLSQIGTSGPGNGQFFNARGVAVGPDGNLYVADSGNSRVEVVGPSGAFVRAWGSAGTGTGQFEQLVGIGVGPSGLVFTTETSGSGGGRIQVFDANGTYLRSWADPTVGIGSIAVDAADHVYVPDNTYAGSLREFDSSGHLITSWGTPGFGPGQFRGLSGIAVDSAGSVYTIEAVGGTSPTASNNRVQKFDGTGNPKADFTDSVGNPSSSFPVDAPASDWIPGIAVEPSGYIDLASNGSFGFQRFTPTGARAAQLGCGMIGLLGLGAAPSGTVYAAGPNGLLVFGDGGALCGGNVATPIVFSGKEGVSIDAGVLYTNDPHVQLTIVPPGGATDVLLANDGGFSAPIDTGSCTGPGTCRVAIQPGGVYAWTLQPAADERLPKTVYVRFANSSSTSATTFTDDIILDTIPPVTASATLSAVAARNGRAAAAQATQRRYVVRVRASDNASGVSTMQLATTKSLPGKWVGYQPQLTLTTSSPPVFVRLRDRAGNVNGWRQITGSTPRKTMELTFPHITKAHVGSGRVTIAVRGSHGQKLSGIRIQVQALIRNTWRTVGHATAGKGVAKVSFRLPATLHDKLTWLRAKGTATGYAPALSTKVRVRVT